MLISSSFSQKSIKKAKSANEVRIDGNGIVDKVESRSKRKPFRIPTDLEQFEKLERTVYRWVDDAARRRQSSERERQRTIERWLEGLGRRDKKLLHATNPWAGEEWCGFLAKAFDELAPTETPLAVTVLDHNWDRVVGNYSHVDPSDLHEVMQAMRKQLQLAFRGIPYLFMVDVSVDRQAKAHDNYRRLCLHLHGVVWAERELVKKVGRHFAGGHYGAPALKVRTMEDYGWLSYATRDPRMGNHWWFDPSAERKYGRRNEPICSGQRIHLLRLFRHVAKPDLCFGSGVGLSIKQRATQLAKARGYKPRQRGGDWSVVFPCDALRHRPLDCLPPTDPYYDG